jgi:hypothetical protein
VTRPPSQAQGLGQASRPSTAPHRTAPRTAPHRTVPHRTPPRTAPYRTAPHRTPPRTAPRPAPHRAPHRTAPHRTAPHRTPPHIHPRQHRTAPHIHPKHRTHLHPTSTPDSTAPHRISAPSSTAPPPPPRRAVLLAPPRARRAGVHAPHLAHHSGARSGEAGAAGGGGREGAAGQGGGQAVRFPDPARGGAGAPLHQALPRHLGGRAQRVQRGARHWWAQGPATRRAGVASLLPLLPLHRSQHRLRPRPQALQGGSSCSWCRRWGQRRDRGAAQLATTSPRHALGSTPCHRAECCASGAGPASLPPRDQPCAPVPSIPHATPPTPQALAARSRSRSPQRNP